MKRPRTRNTKKRLTVSRCVVDYFGELYLKFKVSHETFVSVADLEAAGIDLNDKEAIEEYVGVAVANGMLDIDERNEVTLLGKDGKPCG